MGGDEISAHLLKTAAPVIPSSVTKLINHCIASGHTPDEWKEANITPVPKSLSANLPSQFRPISVLPVIAKVYESLIHMQLYSYLVKNSLLHPSESGFRPRHSTQDVLLKTVDDWHMALDMGHDYCSTVWHSSCSQSLSNSIERVQNYAMRVILHQPPQTPSAPLRHKLGWSTLWQRQHRHMLCQVHKCVLQIAPPPVPPPYILQANSQSTQPFTHQRA